MGKTDIEWTDCTWNPVRGCSRVSEGCRNCYAERIAARFSNVGSVEAGEFVGFAERTPSGPRWTGKVQLIDSKLEEPLHWKKPRRVFVNSMSDLFHEALPDESIDRVFAVMALCPQHTFQVLTKRAERMRRWISAMEWSTGTPLPNVWLGVSVEDDSQQQRIREIVKTPAAIRFISHEPALGPLGLQWALPNIQWVICGGESGPGARPFDLAWARSARDQCQAAGVAFFMKQLGAHPFDDGTLPTERLLNDRKGGDMSEWPADLRVRKFPVKGVS